MGGSVACEAAGGSKALMADSILSSRIRVAHSSGSHLDLLPRPPPSDTPPCAHAQSGEGRAEAARESCWLPLGNVHKQGTRAHAHCYLPPKGTENSYCLLRTCHVPTPSELSLANSPAWCPLWVSQRLIIPQAQDWALASSGCTSFSPLLTTGSGLTPSTSPHPKPCQFTLVALPPLLTSDAGLSPAPRRCSDPCALHPVLPSAATAKASPRASS